MSSKLYVALFAAATSLSCKTLSVASEVREETRIGDQTYDLEDNVLGSRDECRARMAREMPLFFGDVADASAGDARIRTLATHARAGAAEHGIESTFFDQELAATRLYTLDGYKLLNKTLRGRDRHANATVACTVLSVSSLLSKRRATAPYSGIALRGASLPSAAKLRYLEAWKRGSSIVERGFLSATYAASIPAAFAGDVVFKIKTEKGSNVQPFSAYPSEREILFAPGAAFKITRITAGSSLALAEEAISPARNDSDIFASAYGPGMIEGGELVTEGGAAPAEAGLALSELDPSQPWVIEMTHVAASPQTRPASVDATDVAHGSAHAVSVTRLAEADGGSSHLLRCDAVMVGGAELFYVTRVQDGARFATFGGDAHGYWLDRQSCQTSVDSARRGLVCIKDQSQYTIDANRIFSIETLESADSAAYLSFKGCLGALEARR